MDRQGAGVNTGISVGLLTLALVGATTVAAPPGGHWPQWRGPLRDGVSTETGLLPQWPAGGPPKLYSATGLGNGFSSVAIAGGRILTMGDAGGAQHVIALDEETGKRLWATRIGAPNRRSDGFDGPRGTPTIDGDLVFALGSDGTLVALDVATGRERWRKHLERDFGGQVMSSWQWSESPLVDGERVVVTPGGSRAGMVALNKTTGAEIWRSRFPRGDGAGYSSIVISNGGGVKQYVQLTENGVIGVRAGDGQYLWGNSAVANGTANISTPVVKDNLVFASTAYGTGSVLVELRPSTEMRVTAVERYFLNEFQNHHGGFVAIGNYLYGGHGSSNGFPTCIEIATGKLMWPRARSSAGSGSAAVTAAEGRLYFRYQNGVVVLIDASPAAYRELGTLRIPNPHEYSWPHPVIAAGRLYLREQDSLHVYNIKR